MKFSDLPGRTIEEKLAALPPEKRDLLLEGLKRRTQAQAFYCDRGRNCDGMPHEGYAYNHARADQWPPLGVPGVDWRHWIIASGRGAGKLLALDTPVPTPTGWTTMGELQDGDEVFDEQGQVCRVVKAHPVQLPERAFRLTFSDHSQIVAGGEHQWVTWTHRDRKALNRSGQAFPADWVNWRSTKSFDYSKQGRPAGLARALELMEQGWSQRKAAAEAQVSRGAIRNFLNQSYARFSVETGIGPAIRTTDEIVATFRHGDRGDLNHSIPTAAPLSLPSRDLPLDPYILGAWLGDGETNGGGFTQHVDDADPLMAALAEWSPIARPDKRNPTTLRIGTRGLSAILKEVGVRGRKHIPAAYLRASVRQRLDLLAGLMDTDGHVTLDGLCEYTTVVRELADGVVELLRTLGHKPVLKESDATLQGRITGKRYRITWRPTFNPSRLPRKVERFRPLGNQGSRSRQRMIVGYEEIDPIPMRCITVDSPNSMYLAGEAMIPTHNTKTGSEYSRRLSRKMRRMGIIAPTAADLRSTIVEGPSGLIRACELAGEPGEYEPSKRRFTFASGAQVLLFSAEEPDRLRGSQCFVAGTIVETESGPRPIESIKVGERVWTRQGLRPVIHTKVSVRPVISSGPLTGTPDHRVWTENRGWTRLDLITPDDIVVRWNPTFTRPQVGATSSPEGDADQSLMHAGSGSSTSAPSRATEKSTTSTGTDSTTGSAISPSSPPKSTSGHTPIWYEPVSAHSAGWSSSMPSGDGSASSATDVLPSADENLTGGPTQGAAGSSRPASSAGPSSSPDPGRSVVSGASISGRTETVYDLSVESDPEFFANGVLVHNCEFWWGDEPAHWAKVEEVWEQINFTLRLGDNPHVLLTTTPLPTKWMKKVMADPRSRVVRVSTFANAANLAEDFIATVRAAYEGTRMGRQELYGEILEDVEGALWNMDMFRHEEIERDALTRVVIGVDPAGSTGKKSDETGIVVVGQMGEHLYVLEDATGKYTPQQWANQVDKMVEKWGADVVAVERNFGGDMVKHTLKSIDSLVRIKEVRATRGKRVRAEPIVALYEQQRVNHFRGLEKLEEELVTWVPDSGMASPNRLDALVWACSELAKPGVATFHTARGLRIPR